MGIQVCQKAVFTRDATIPGLLIPSITDTERCETAITGGQAMTALSKFTSPGTSRCKYWDGAFTYDVRCYPVGPIETSVEKPTWLQRIGIKISDFWNQIF